MMFEEFENFRKRLSEAADKALHDSERIARLMGAVPDTEHLLIALASNPNTLAYEALHELTVNPERITFIINKKDTTLKVADRISDDYKKVIKTAFRKAFEYNSPVVDTEHLLLGILLIQGCNGYQILKTLGIDLEQLTNQLEHYFEGTTEPTDGSQMYFGPDSNQPFPGQADQQFGPLPPGTTEKARSKSAIDHFTIDLTRLARLGKLDNVIGREKEMRRAIQILVRRIKNNPVLVGEPGVGKTAIVEGLAQRIALGDVPSQLANKRVISLDIALLVAGTTYRGQFEERTKKLVDEIIKDENIILFVDEVHSIVGAGTAEGSLDLGTIIKPALAKGKLRLIGATTNDEYRKFIEKDAALERRLQRIQVEEPTIEEAVEILRGVKEAYEKHHNVVITDEAVVSAVELSKRYINDRFLPDKAIDLIDEASAAAQTEPKNQKTYNQVSELEKRIAFSRNEHQRAAENLNYEKAAEHRVLELRLTNELEKLKKRLPKKATIKTISREEIAKIVSMWTGIPYSSLNRVDKVRLANIEPTIKAHIIGQDDAVRSISQAIRRSSTGVGDPNRPLGSFMFLGPTGVGKTELAKVLAREVFGREESLVKIDMSEFMEKHNVSRLVGAPPGYVGYEEAGKLTETIRRQPYSVVLLDEIEKAHPDVFNMLLQIMEDGYLTDAKGRRVNFKNTIIIMTSNIGMAEMNRQAAIGFKTNAEYDANAKFEEIKNQLQDKLKEQFRPEFLNRLDKVIIFRPLSEEDVKKIVELQLSKLEMRLIAEGINLEVEEPAKEFLAHKGFDPQFGARPVRRAITDYVEDPLSEALLSGKFSKKTPIRVLRKGEKLALVK